MDKSLVRYDLFKANRVTVGDGKRVLFWDRPVKYIFNSPLRGDLIKDPVFNDALNRLERNQTIQRIQVRGPWVFKTLYQWMGN